MAQQIGATSLALPSPSSVSDRLSAKPVNPKTIEMIGDLGLRFPPSTKQDEAGRAGLLRFLAEDLAHIHPSALEAAIREWARTKAFMPKASELINLAEKATRDRQRAARPTSGETLADRANARLAALDPPLPPMWAMRGTGKGATCEFVGPHVEREPAEPFTRAELQEMVDAPRNSYPGQILSMGLTGGFIEDMGGGNYREAGGMFTVCRTSANSEPEVQSAGWE